MVYALATFSRQERPDGHFADVTFVIAALAADCCIEVCLFDLHLVLLQATLCSKKSCLQALVAQLASDSEELHQVVSSILRNLSWRADISSKRVLRDIGCVSALMTCALQATKVTENKPTHTEEKQEQ